MTNTEPAERSAKPSRQQKNKQDPHYRPDTVDPSEYVQVGLADTKTGYFRILHNELRGYGIITGSTNPYSPDGVPFHEHGKGDPNYQCMHCHKRGAGIRYFVFFLHLPTRKVVVFGRDCAVRFNLTTKQDANIEAERDQYQQSSSWRDEHPVEYNFLSQYAEERTKGGKFVEFFDSLWKRLQERGHISPEQLSGLHKWMANRGVHVDADRHQGKVTQTEASVSDGQRVYISKLCDQLNKDVPNMTEMSRAGAEKLINDLKAEKQERWRNEPPTENQLSAINRLMDERVLPPDTRQEARRRIDAGLTKGRASDCIGWLKTFEVRSTK